MTNFTTANEAIKSAEKHAVAHATFIDFEGHNCVEVGNEDCNGWDGISYRCDCGNRRVAWDAYKNLATGFFEAYAVAH